MVVSAPDYVKQRYELKNLKPLENNVAEQVNLKTPFNNPITGWVRLIFVPKFCFKF
jgi:homocitrate synthase